MSLEQFGISLSKFFPSFVNYVHLDLDRHSLVVGTDRPFELLRLVRDSHFFQCKQLLDVWCVDYPASAERFQINYMVLSVRYGLRFTIRTTVGGEHPVLSSVVSLYPSAGWLEREVWDLFGVFFKNNQDLRRILTDYGFQGHPLRKDFPLSGYTQLRYDDENKQIVSEPVSFAQEYRYFDFLSPWKEVQE